MKINLDNKKGMILCNRLAAKPLSKRDKELVNSIMRQILKNPNGFKLSVKQFNWLQDIYRRWSNS